MRNRGTLNSTLSVPSLPRRDATPARSYFPPAPRARGRSDQPISGCAEWTHSPRRECPSTQEMSTTHPLKAIMFATGHLASVCSPNSRNCPGGIGWPFARKTVTLPHTRWGLAGISGVFSMGSCIAPRASLCTSRSKSIFSMSSRGVMDRATNMAVACSHPIRAPRRSSTAVIRVGVVCESEG